jgi:hypothetical protein
MTALGAAPWVQALGWTLVQFLWQGTVIWAVYALIRALTRRRLSAHARYAMACATLGLMAATPLWTLHEQLGTPLVPALTIWSPDAWRVALPWLVAAWMSGVLVFCWRLVDGWRAASRLRSLRTGPAPWEWRQTLETLALRAGVSRPIRLLTSALIEIPVVIGWWRPVILAPTAMLAGLPPAYLESMLAHELAHIRRIDYLVNLLQGVVEAALFYHPAVWWVSREIRAERERCCDDEAVRLVGDVWAYAHALAELEARRPAHRQALAANGGSLVDRIRRLLGQAPAVDALPGIGVVAAMSAVWLIGIGAAGAHAAPRALSLSPEPQLAVTVRATIPSARPVLSSLMFAPIGPTVESHQTPHVPAKPADAAMVMGRVVDADSGAPVPGAIVELHVDPSRSGSGVGSDFIVLNNVQSQGGGFVIRGPGNTSTSVLTGGDGQFVFRNVSSGRADFAVTATGYTGGAYHQLRPEGSGQSLDIADGQRLTDVTLKMWKDGAISGRITDEAGDAVVGARVQVLRRSSVAGQWTPILSAHAHRTDDRGTYRVSGLLPGDYLVEVPLTRVTTLVSALDAADQGRQSGPVVGGRGLAARGPVASSGQLVGNVFVGSGLRLSGDPDALGPVVSSDGRMTAYASTFYPAASTSSRAIIITLKSAEERVNIDVQLTAARAFRISGTLLDLDGSPATTLAIHLLPVDDQNRPDGAAEDVATTVSGPRGEFTLAGVPAGPYQLTVLRSAPGAGGRGGRGAGPVAAPPTGLDAETAWARQSVSVGDADVSGLTLALHQGITVTGRVVFEGSSTQPTGQQLQRGIRAQPMNPGLRGGGRGGGTPAAIVAQLSTDGSFTMTGLTPGTYEFIAPGWPLLKWTPKSVLVAGRDVSDATIDIDSDISGAVVTFTDRPGVLAGAVHRTTGEPDASALVVGFPTDPRAPGGSGLHAFTQRVGADGTYTVPALAPGEYNVVAIPDALAQNWQDPAILQQLIPLAIRVRVDEGMHIKQDLTTSAVR